MIHTCAQIENCRFCSLISKTFAHPIEKTFGRKWKKIYKHEVIIHMKGLRLQIIGGLVRRGWTIHDIDVVGNPDDVHIFVERLRKAGINNPVHYGSGLRKHSHFICLFDGLKVILQGQ